MWRGLFVTRQLEPNCPMTQVQGVVAMSGDFCSGDVQVYTIRATFAMMAPLRSFAEGVPHGRYDSAYPSGGPLAFGVGGRPQAQHSGTYRYLLPAAPRSCPFLWSWRGGSAPGDSRWSS